MSLFIVTSAHIRDNEIRFPEEESYHLHVVLRKKAGDKIDCKDDTDARYGCVIRISEKNRVVADIISITHPDKKGSTKLTLVFPLLKGGKTEWILQKGTELGVDTFIPFLFKRTVSKPDWQKKEPRYLKIIHESCKQTERGDEPELYPMQTDPERLAELLRPEPGLRIVCWEMEKRVRLKELLRGETTRPEHVVVAIGPEGGIAEEEIGLFRNAGFLSSGLGDQILRSETACLAAAAMIQYEYC